MLNLIAKDFKLLFVNKGGKLSRFLSIIFTLAIVSLFVFIETTIFTSILDKIKVYNTAGKSFLTIFLFVVMVVLSMFSLITANKLFFNEQDNLQLSSFPISNGKKVFSKLISLFLICYGINFIFNFPILISYGITFNKVLFYFYASLYYPVLLFLVEGALAMFLLFPTKLLLDFLKKHFIIQLIFASLIGIGLAIIYGYILDVFVNVVSSNRVDLIFTTDSLNNLSNISKNLFPITLLIELFVKGKIINLFTYILICGGLLIVGVAFVTYFYDKFTFAINFEKNKKKEKKIKLNSLTLSLIKKEFIILYRNSNFVISFIGLLIIEPFLLSFIFQAMNKIFSYGLLASYLLAIPTLSISFDLLIFMLLIAIISSGGTSFITSEENNIRIMKTLPIQPEKQLFVKIFVHFVPVSFFCLLSSIAISLSKHVDFVHTLCFFVITISYILLIDLISMYEELKIKHNSRNYLLSSLATYLIPLFIFFISVIFSYFKISIYFAYLIGFAICIACSLPISFDMKAKSRKWFLDMEVAN